MKTIKKQWKQIGDFKELKLQNTYYAYARAFENKSVIITVNNGDKSVSMTFAAGHSEKYVGALTGKRVIAKGGRIRVTVPANSGEIWIPAEIYSESIAPIKDIEIKKALLPASPAKKSKKPELVKERQVIVDWNKRYEDMSIEELQEAILEKMRKNGPVTDYMLGTVRENTHHGSLVTWVNSFQ